MSDTLKALNRERYARAAEKYVASAVHATGMGLPRMLELAEMQANWQVLDVATGGGHTAYHFAPHVKTVIASDFTERMAQSAQNFVREQGVNNIKGIVTCLCEYFSLDLAFKLRFGYDQFFD